MKRSFEEVHLIKGGIEDTVNVYSFESNHLVAMCQNSLQKALDELNSANKHEIHQAIVESCVDIKPEQALSSHKTLGS